MTEQTQPIQVPKLTLKREEEQELKVYFFIARQDKIEVQNEMVQATLAYRLEDALLRAKQEAKEWQVVYHGQNVPVRELIEKIYIEKSIAPPITDEKLPEIPQKEMTKQNFIWNCLLLADKFIEDPQKREQLKELLKEIKIDEKKEK